MKDFAAVSGAVDVGIHWELEFGKMEGEGTTSLLLRAAQRGSLLNNGSFPMLSPVASDHKRGILESAFSR